MLKGRNTTFPKQFLLCWSLLSGTAIFKLTLNSLIYILKLYLYSFFFNMLGILNLVRAHFAAPLSASYAYECPFFVSIRGDIDSGPKLSAFREADNRWRENKM